MVKVWDAATGEEQLTITIEEESRGEFVYAAWSPSGDRILAGPSNGLGAKVYDAATGTEYYTLYPGRKTVWNCGFAWSSSGEYVLTGLAESGATLWDSATGEELFTLRGHDGALTAAIEPCVTWSPDGTLVATMSQDGTAMVWDARTVYTLAGHTDTVISAYWSPSADRILTVAYDGTARVWDAASGLELMSVDYGARRVSFARWSPTGDRFVIGARTMVNVWVAAKGTKLYTISIPDHQRLVTADWSPDGTRLATGHDFDTSIRLWDANTGEAFQLLGFHTNASGRSITEVKWSPSGDRILSACTDFTVKVWDPSTGNELYTLDDFQGPVTAAAWSPDGKRIGTYSKDGIGRIWDAQTAKLILEFSGHTGETWSLTWSPSGERIITGSSDGTARVWDAATGVQVLHYPIGSPTGYIAWSSDGKSILVPYDDKVVMLPIWQTTRELIGYAHECCVVRDLSPEDRELYGLSTDE
jgi:WD40 repeat protein